LTTLLNCSSFWSNSNVFVLLALPQEIKVEFAVVREHNLLCLYFVDKELAEIQLEWFVLLDFCQRLICHYSVVDLVAFAFDIQN
jgi:hypothetical protein